MLTDPTAHGLLKLEGKDYAHAFLSAMYENRAYPDLYHLVQFLSGPTLEGFCAELTDTLLYLGSVPSGSTCGCAHERCPAVAAQG